MVDIIQGLRQEHRNIESLLRVLERELSVFDRGERPDYEVVLAVLDYFKDYPDCCHHPKEDMIVEKLKARDPVAAATIGDLAGEHQEGTRRLGRVAQAVERVLSDQDLVRQNVDNIIRDFIDHERQHMAMEERIVFPTALDALRPEDWADIALKMADRYDPFYQPGFEDSLSPADFGNLIAEDRGILRHEHKLGASDRAPDHCGLMPANLITLVH